jgi:hypothetical protein
LVAQAAAEAKGKAKAKAKAKAGVVDNSLANWGRFADSPDSGG